MKKNYNSTTEGTWVELLTVKLTQEEKELLSSKKEEDLDSKKDLIYRIKSEREKSVDSEKVTELSNIYDSVKPALKEGDVYQLISIDVSENNTGILNCRINGEHNQVRF